MPRVGREATTIKPTIGVYSSDTTNKNTAGQFEYDVTSFRDPAGQKQFVGLNGTHPTVRDWMKLDHRVNVIVQECMLLADDLVKEKKADDKVTPPVCNWLTFTFKDFHGKWAGPAIAEIVTDALSDAGYMVVTYHGVLPKEAVWPTTVS